MRNKSPGYKCPIGNKVLENKSFLSVSRTHILKGTLVLLTWGTNIWIQNSLEQKSLEKKSLEQKSLEQKSLEQKSLEQKSLEQKSLEQKSLEVWGMNPSPQADKCILTF